MATAFALLPTEDNLTRGTTNFAVDTGTANAYIVALPHTPSGYVDGLRVTFRPLNANTGACTINVNSLGVKSIRRTDSTACDGGDITAGGIYELFYSTASGFFHLSLNPNAATLTGGPVTSVNGLTGAVTGIATTAANTFTGAQELPTGSNVASAATINLDTATGNRVHITGTTTITAVTLTRGPRTVIFDGVLTLTHHATTNNLPGAANITTAAGDRAIYESDGTTVYCVNYIRASGSAGGLILLSTVTASGSATVDIESTFSSTYDSYILIGSGITHDMDNNTFELLMKLGGVYVASSYRYVYHAKQDLANTYASTASGAANSVPLGLTLGSAAAHSANLVIRVFNPASTTFKKQIRWEMSGLASSGSLSIVNGSATNIDTAALTGLRIRNLSAPSGLISGTFRLYGITNS